MSERNIRIRHHTVATEEDFDPGPLPVFLLSADEPEQDTANDKAVISLRGLMASLLVAAAIAIGIAILSDQVTLFATASLVDNSAPQPGTNQPTPTIKSAVTQPINAVEALPPTAKDVPTREIAAASEPASKTQMESSEPSSEALFREFQAWSAEQDAQALAKPVQDAPARVVENAPASVRPMQKHRRARSVNSARAETRHVREHRANVQHRQAHARPVQDARAQTEPVQNAEPPSFLESLNPFAGWPTLTIR
jgi:DNA polymerase III gamma/tau subunit